MGKCPDCGAWDSLDAQRLEPKAKVDPRAASLATWSAHERAEAALGPDDPASTSSPSPFLTDPDLPSNAARPFADLALSASKPARRIPTTIPEFDRVLGGGFVPGSAVLLGGDPGIGKSTLLLQAAGALAATGTRTLYVSSEESAEQVALRASRLGVAAKSPNTDLFLLSETSLSRILEQAARVLSDAPEAKPPVLIIDSVQMIYKADLDAFPGSLTQLRRCCAELTYFAKASGVTVVLVGHVTKDGQLAGPRLLEHLVDAVLYFEGDRYHAHRIVRAVKNRFGTTLELGLFEMTGSGLQQAPDGPGLALLASLNQPRPGTVVCPVMTGTRCLMVELQALTATGFLGAAKRKASGIDANRLAMLIAVLEQHAGMRLADRDIFTSSVGGVKITEPAADLPLLLAIAGAMLRRPLSPPSASSNAATPRAIAAVGEVGLGGEIRPVSQLNARIHESKRLGFTALLIPAPLKPADLPKTTGIELIQVKNISQAIEMLG